MNNHPKHSWEKEKEEVPASGVYLLVLYLPGDSSLPVGRRGIIDFPGGYYIYVGRAQKNLPSRLKRHLTRLEKLHWHIDYFRQKARVKSIWLKTREISDNLPADECTLAAKLRHYSPFELPQIKRLGSSDCGCPGHFIYWGRNYRKIISFLSQASYLRRIDYGLLF